MDVNEKNIRLIFGLKLKQFRKEKKLSLSELSKKSGLSISYLNEIENGKKYPKSDKIIALSAALDVSYDQLVSLKFNKQLEPVASILNSDIFDELPYETFGLSKEAIIHLIANAPVKVSAFIGAMIEIARNYNMKQEHFYFASLRSYQEMHYNYFEEIEASVETCIKEFNIDITPPISAQSIADILIKKHQYDIQKTSFEAYPKLKNFRSVCFQKKNEKLLLHNTWLTNQQCAFLFSKELGFQHLNIQERPYTSSWLKAESFEQVLNNFRASYFSCALLINRTLFIEDLTALFQKKKWNNHFFLQLIQKYNASPEMFMHRLTNILPTFFGLKQLSFIRYNSRSEAQEINKELHLTRSFATSNHHMDEITYRRWTTQHIIRYLKRKSKEHTSSNLLVNVIRSRYPEKENEYFYISLYQPNSTNASSDSVTIGFVVTESVRKKIAFLDDPDIFFLETDHTFRSEIQEPEVVRRQIDISDCEQELALLKKNIFSK